MAVLTPTPKQQIFGTDGKPLVGGKIYTYSAGTTTPLATYTDAGGGTANTNPIVLNSMGQADIWLAQTSAYKFSVYTSTDVLLYTVDNILASTATVTTVTYADNTVQASAQVGMKNRIIDGGFVINQRSYVSGTALAAGIYGHDRFKGGASGGTYTFTQGSLGVNTTVTITAGTLVQVIEGCNLPEGGTYVLSWTGTAQGRLNGGAYGASGTVTVTGWVAGTNLSVEFNTGTCGNIQLEKGSIATTFDYRPYATEFQLCQRYYQRLYVAQDVHGGSLNIASTYLPVSYFSIQPMRTTPTTTQVNNTTNFSGTTSIAAVTSSVIDFYGNRSSAGWNSGSNICSATAVMDSEL